jgi:hypothetical protein
MLTLSELKDIATIVGVLVAAASLAIAARNTRLAVRTNRAKRDHAGPEAHRRANIHGDLPLSIGQLARERLGEAREAVQEAGRMEANARTPQEGAARGQMRLERC